MRTCTNGSRTWARRYMAATPLPRALRPNCYAVIHALVQYPWLVNLPHQPGDQRALPRLPSAFRRQGRPARRPGVARTGVPARRQIGALLEELYPQTRQLGRPGRGLLPQVDRRTAVLNQLTSLLKGYPQALQLLENLNTELAVAFCGAGPTCSASRPPCPGSSNASTTPTRFVRRPWSSSVWTWSPAVALTTDPARLERGRPAVAPTAR